jgi:hypothetical protein
MNLRFFGDERRQRFSVDGFDDEFDRLVAFSADRVVAVTDADEAIAETLEQLAGALLAGLADGLDEHGNSLAIRGGSIRREGRTGVKVWRAAGLRV